MMALNTQQLPQLARDTPRVLFATPELAPWIKTGGLGEVSADLTQALLLDGLDVKVLLPGYPAAQAAARAHGCELAEVGIVPARWGYPQARLLETRRPGGVHVLLLDCPALLDRAGGPYQDKSGCDHADNALRFGLLAWVAALLSSDASPLNWRADVLHCNDWPTALAPLYLRRDLRHPVASLMTIHNLAFQGFFDAGLAPQLGLAPKELRAWGAEHHGGLSMLKAGLYNADRISTVSPGYAREIQLEPLGFGLHELLAARADVLDGILNGIDTAVWNPARDPHIHRHYDLHSLPLKAGNKAALQSRMGIQTDAGALLIGMVGRLTEQKGVDLVMGAMNALLRRPVQFVVLGQGKSEFEAAWRALAQAHPQRIAVTIGFDEGLAHQIEAGADTFLMPSRFEPCGLNQMYSQRYGTPPIVRNTGGLADSVCSLARGGGPPGYATGFGFDDATPAALLAAVDQALRVYADKPAWGHVCANGMQRDFSWEASARRYGALYALMQADRSQGP